MGGAKTRDGVKLSRIEKLLRSMGAEVRAGTNHPMLAIYSGQLDDYTRTKPTCPIASSTTFKTQIVPWIRKTFGYNKHQVYQALAGYA